MSLTPRNALVLFIASTLLLLAIEAWIASSLLYVQDPGALAVAISADVVIGIPLLYYVLLARRRYLPVGGIVALYFLSVAAVRFILPSSLQSHLAFMEILTPLFELAALAVVFLKGRALVGHVRQAQVTEVYFADALRTGVQRALGQSLTTALLATEFSQLYFALVGWFRGLLSKPGFRAFTYHRQSGHIAVFSGILFVIVVETVALHLIIQIWNGIAAWIVTALGIYTVLWMLGYYQSTRLQPIMLNDTHLCLRTGFRWRARIRLADIVEVRPTTTDDSRASSFVNAAVFGGPRLVIRLAASTPVTDFFGRSKAACLIGVTVDNEEEFRAELSRHVGP